MGIVLGNVNGCPEGPRKRDDSRKKAVFKNLKGPLKIEMEWIPEQQRAFQQFEISLDAMAMSSNLLYNND